ncbi:hypothetical protein OSB04_025669 [Centaurea solstitialis]|uniref:HTH myb-type domain-containing protein n=1 Tax=Centaurea solstitialis TaxID=347529 RepID=A0AA38W1Y5_9ASTR|nr:hypothetical protein OSB04_025669 [Centaurea solstitialis]
MSFDDEEGEILKGFEHDNELLAMKKRSKSESRGNRCGITKKNKVIWTPDLHNKFLEAINKLGVDRAVPTKIIDLMKVDGLTRDHIASHLQKYRVFLKKIAEANYRDQIASPPVLLESSISNLGVHPTQVQNNWSFYSGINHPILDTSSFSFPILETSSSTTANPSKITNYPSLPNQGSSMQDTEILEHTMPESLDGQGYSIDNGAELGIGNLASVVNSSNSVFMPNLDGIIYDYGDIQMVSSGDHVHSNMELPMSTYPTNTSGSSYMQNTNLEMSSLYDSNSNKEPLSSWNNEMEMNTNLEIKIGEDDLTLDEAEIATLWEVFIPEDRYIDHRAKYGSTSNDPNPPAFLEPPPNQQLTNVETTVIDMQQGLDYEYLPGFDQTNFNMYDIDEQLLALESSPEPVDEDTTLQDPFWIPFDQDL